MKVVCHCGEQMDTQAGIEAVRLKLRFKLKEKVSPDANFPIRARQSTYIHKIKLKYFK